MNTKRKGRNFDLRVRDWYVSQGYGVVVSAASLSPFDLVAMRGGSTFGVQCKNMIARMTIKEWNELWKFAQLTGAIPLLAEKVQGKSKFTVTHIEGPIDANHSRGMVSVIVGTFDIPKREKKNG